MTVIQRLAKSLQIRDGEGQLVLMFWLYSFCLGLALVFSLTAGNALFISQLGSQSLPYVYLAGALVVPLTGAIYLKGEKKLTFRQLLWANMTVCFVVFGTLRVAFFVADLRIASAALLIWYDVLFALSNFAFWGLASRLFHIRQAKRLYGLIGSGEVLAGIVGGFSVPLMLNWMETQDLLLCCGAAIAASLLVVGIILRRHSSEMTTAKNESEDTSIIPGSVGYVKLIAAVTGVCFFTYYVVDKAFYDQAQDRLSDPEKLASFLGQFFGIVEFFKYISRLFFTGRFLSAFGARLGLVTMPLVVTVVALMAVASSALRLVGDVFFWLVCATKLLDRVLRFAIDRPSILVFYQPLPPRQRGAAQAIAEGIAGPISGGLAGLALLSVDASGLPERWSLIILLPILGSWIWLARQLGHRYIDILSAVLEQNRVKRRHQTPDLSDREILSKHLRSPCTTTVILAAELLEETDSDALVAELPRLVTHSDSRQCRDS